MPNPLPNLAELDASWAEWIKEKNPQGKPTQAAKWRQDNPGEWSKLKLYYEQKAPRPTLTTIHGKQMVHFVAALIEARGSADPIPPPPKYAPQTYNKGSSGQNARYCTKDSGNPDGMGVHYDADGRQTGSERSEQFVPGLRPADEMNNQGPCDPYLNFPPWPAKSHER